MRGTLWVLVLTMAFAACSSGDDDSADKTFRDGRFAFTFVYPGTLETAELKSVVTREGEGEAEERATLALDEQDVVVVSKYRIDGTVPKGDLDPAVTREVNTVVEGLVGKPVDGKPVQIGGLPAVDYERVEVPRRPGLESHLVYLFDGNVEYEINCQSTPDKRAQIAKACEQVLATLKPV